MFQYETGGGHGAWVFPFCLLNLVMENIPFLQDYREYMFCIISAPGCRLRPADSLVAHPGINFRVDARSTSVFFDWQHGFPIARHQIVMGGRRRITNSP